MHEEGPEIPGSWTLLDVLLVFHLTSDKTSKEMSDGPGSDAIVTSHLCYCINCVISLNAFELGI